jgi:2'-5' RNA ligase
MPLPLANIEPPLRRRIGDDQLLYFMLKPPHALALAIDRERRRLGLDCSYALKKFHITLQPLGDIRAIAPEALERIGQAAASLHAEPFPVQLDRLRGNALVGSNARALRAFQRRLVRRLAAFGVYLPDYEFDPHLSLRYEDWRPRSAPIVPIRWLVDELLLVNSVHGKGHALVHRWPLVPLQGSFDF